MMEPEVHLYPRLLIQNINSAGQSVAIVGSILQLRENKTLILECDTQNKRTVLVKIPSSTEIAPLKEIKYIEIRGQTAENGEIMMKEYTNLHENFDLKTYNEMLTLAFKEFPEIFNYKKGA